MDLGNLTLIPNSYIPSNVATSSTNNGSGNNIPTIEEQIAQIKNRIPDVPGGIPKYRDALWKKINKTLTKSQDASEQAKRIEEENEIIERMQENRKYLMDANQADWTKIVVTLPDIFISAYDKNRFKFEPDRYIQMIYRTKYINNLLNMINTNKDEQRFNYYLSGHSGSGKSALLYQLACSLMSTDEYVVGYVQYSTENLFADILRSLYFECKRISVDFEYLDQLKTEEAKARFRVLTVSEVLAISKLVRNVKEKLLVNHSMKLVFIIDQTNNLLRNKNKFELMIDFIKNNLLPHHIVIMSGSANNDVEKFPGVEPQLVRLPFSEEELKAFIITNRPDTSEHKIWCDDQIISQILSITGSVAIEINRFVNGYYNGTEQIRSSATLEQRFGKYDSLYRVQYNPGVLREWYLKQVEKKSDEIAIDNIERCFTGVDLMDTNPEVFDKRLIIKVQKVIRKNEDNEDELVMLDDFELDRDDDVDCRWYLMPISPVARKCLFDTYHQLIKLSDFKKQFNLFFKNNKLNPTQKGFYVKQLLITLISLGILKEVVVYTISPNRKFEDSPKTKLIFENLTVINFGGYFAPSKQMDPNSQVGANLLFVPTAYNYPGFDFFSYTPNPKAALFHQVTIMKNCHEHVASNDAKATSGSQKVGTLPPAMRSWATFLPNDARVYDIYFLRMNELDTSQLSRTCNFVFLEEIHGEGLDFLSSHFQGCAKGFSV